MTPELIDTARKPHEVGDKQTMVAKLLRIEVSPVYRHYPGSQNLPS